MGYQEARELARIRYQLRELLAAGSDSGAHELLAHLRDAAGDDKAIHSELNRWTLRFSLLRGRQSPA